MACLETSFLIDVLQANEAAREVMEDLDDSGVRPSVAPVAAAEVWVGAHLGSRAEHAATRELLESLTWLPFTREVRGSRATFRQRSHRRVRRSVSRTV